MHTRPSAALPRLCKQVYAFGVLLSRLDAVVWAVAAGTGEVPLEGLPPLTGPSGERERRCGYVGPPNKE